MWFPYNNFFKYRGDWNLLSVNISSVHLRGDFGTTVELGSMDREEFSTSSDYWDKWSWIPNKAAETWQQPERSRGNPARTKEYKAKV